LFAQGDTQAQLVRAIAAARIVLKDKMNERPNAG
jgi:hypothetical protein